MKFRVIGIYYLDSEEYIFVGKMDKYDQYELISFWYRRQTCPDNSKHHIYLLSVFSSMKISWCRLEKIYHLWINKYDVNTNLYQLLIVKLSPLSYGGMGGSREDDEWWMIGVSVSVWSYRSIPTLPSHIYLSTPAYPDQHLSRPIQSNHTISQTLPSHIYLSTPAYTDQCLSRPIQSNYTISVTQVLGL